MPHYYLLVGKPEVIEEAARRLAESRIVGIVGLSLGSRDDAPCPDLIDAAVAAERERCAKLAESFGGAPPNPNDRRGRLAAMIREGLPSQP